jgi:hypothetical protein
MRWSKEGDVIRIRRGVIRHIGVGDCDISPLNKDDQF